MILDVYTEPGSCQLCGGHLQPLGFFDGDGTAGVAYGCPPCDAKRMADRNRELVAFGKEFRELRLKYEVSLHQMARLCAMTPAKISAVERGDYELAPDEASSLLARLWTLIAEQETTRERV